MCEIIVCSGGSISNGRSTEIVMDVADYIAYFLGSHIDLQIETCLYYQYICKGIDNLVICEPHLRNTKCFAYLY